MKKIITIIVLSLMIFSNLSYAKRIKVKNCDSSSMEDINWAIDFIDDHLDTMLSQMSFIPNKYKNKLKKKWPSSVFKCSNQKNCKKKEKTLGFHASGNKFKLCWDNIRTRSKTRCELVSVIVHEKAHAANVPIERKHNKANEYPDVRAKDLVYRLDDVVEQHCINITNGVRVQDSTGSSVVESISSGRLGLDNYCSRSSQCASGKCTKNICVCKKDTDCAPSGMRCINKVGKNYCIATSAALGDFCKKNSDCSSNKCNKKSCVCKQDTDCGTGDVRCARRAGKNFCQRTNLSEGDSCSKNSDCSSNKCKKKVCE